MINNGGSLTKEIETNERIIKVASSKLSCDLIKQNKKAYKSPDYPDAAGNTKKPPEALPRTQ